MMYYHSRQGTCASVTLIQQLGFTLSGCKPIGLVAFALLSTMSVPHTSLHTEPLENRVQLAALWA